MAPTETRASKKPESWDLSGLPNINLLVQQVKAINASALPLGFMTEESTKDISKIVYKEYIQHLKPAGVSVNALKLRQWVKKEISKPAETGVGDPTISPLTQQATAMPSQYYGVVPPFYVSGLIPSLGASPMRSIFADRMQYPTNWYNQQPPSGFALDVDDEGIRKKKKHKSSYTVHKPFCIKLMGNGMKKQYQILTISGVVRNNEEKPSVCTGKTEHHIIVTVPVKKQFLKRTLLAPI
jgi:hypothetical protein